MGKKKKLNWGNISAMAILIYLLIPIIILFVSSFDNARRFNFPPRDGLGFRNYISAYNSREYRSALRNSMMVAATATGASLIIGVPAAFAIDRFEFRGKNIVQGAFLTPLMLPHIIWAIGLVTFYSIFGASGTFQGMLFAHVILISPYVIRLVLSSLAFIKRNLEDAAKNLGASPLQTFFLITLPLISPGVLISAVFGFTLSFTDTVIGAFIAGSRWITFPVRMYYQQRTEGLDMIAVAISAVVITAIIFIALVGEKTIKWSEYM